ncbi:hypothetical protein QOT17_008170 [Balamuthia mandrillaris]
MEATAALNTLCEQLCKAQQEYFCMLQQSCQLELDIPSFPETEHIAKEEEQHKLDKTTEYTRNAMKGLQQHIDNFVVFLTSTSATPLFFLSSGMTVCIALAIAPFPSLAYAIQEATSDYNNKIASFHNCLQHSAEASPSSTHVEHPFEPPPVFDDHNEVD